MEDNRNTAKGFLKKGLIFCVIGVMVFSMVACDGTKNKNSNADQPKTKTESYQPVDNNQKNSVTRSNSKKDATKKSNKTNKKSTKTQKSNKSGSATENKKNN